MAHADEDDALKKCLLPANEALRALADLDAMTINHAAVYPEIEGSAQLAVARVVQKFDATLEWGREGTL